MDNLHNNGNFNLFKDQLEDEQKIIILYILRNFPQDIKHEICEAIDQAIDKYLLGIHYDEVDIYLDNEINDLEDYEEEYWYRDEDLYFNDFQDYFDHLQLRNYLETHPDDDSYPDTD